MIYISVVSHGHTKVLNNINCLSKISALSNVKIVLLDNIAEAGLQAWCDSAGVTYFVNSTPLGFGANNNKVFEYCQQLPGFDLVNDWFVVLNPDIELTAEMFKQLQQQLSAEHALYAVDLYKDEGGLISDDSIRRYPSFVDFVSSLLLGVNNTKVDKKTITEPTDVDWAAGSFLVFKASHYRRLGGFDESYFMYCEDIDICFRSATQFDCQVRYLPQIRARHLAQHGNRKIFSKHFYWHVTSTLRFLWRKFIFQNFKRSK